MGLLKEVEDKRERSERRWKDKGGEEREDGGRGRRLKDKGGEEREEGGRGRRWKDKGGEEREKRDGGGGRAETS